MSEETRLCDGCGEVLIDKGIAMIENTKNGYHPECFVTKLKDMIEKGEHVPMFDKMPVDEQKEVIEDPDFLNGLKDMVCMNPETDPRCEKLEDLQ